MFFEKRQRQLNTGGDLGFAVVDGDLIIADDYISARTALKNSDVWAAINVISSDIARVRFYSLEDKKINKLINKPNSTTNRFNFWQSMLAQLLLTGNAYALWTEDVTEKQRLEFVSPSNIQMWLDHDKVTYDIDFDDPDRRALKQVDSKNVIHLKLLGIDGGLSGISPLKSLANELNLQKDNFDYAKTMFGKSVKPSGVLKTSKGMLTKEEKEKVRSEFENANSGTNKGRVLIMDPLFDYNELEVKMDVAKLLSAADWSRVQIAKAFMLPSDLLGAESDHSNVEQIRSMYNVTLGRYLAPVLSELSEKFNTEIHADVREAIDLDGSIVEQRVADLVSRNVISSDIGLNILKDSHSDLITEKILEAKDE